MDFWTTVTAENADEWVKKYVLPPGVKKNTGFCGDGVGYPMDYEETLNAVKSEFEVNKALLSALEKISE